MFTAQVRVVAAVVKKIARASHNHVVIAYVGVRATPAFFRSLSLTRLSGAVD